MTIPLADILAALKDRKIAYTVESLQEEIDVGRSTIYEELNSRRLVGKKCNKVTLIPIWEVVRWLYELPDYIPGRQYIGQPHHNAESEKSARTRKTYTGNSDGFARK